MGHSRLLQLWRPVRSVYEATAVGGCSIGFDFIVEAFGLGLEVKFGQSVRLAVSGIGLRYARLLQMLWWAPKQPSVTLHVAFDT